MDSSKKLILLMVVGVVIALAAIVTRNRVSTPDAQVPDNPRVVVAKRDIAPGTLVQVGADIEWRLPPADLLNPENYLREGNARIEDFGGAVVRRQLRAGEPIPQNAIMRSGEGGFMSAVLEPGMRAVTISVTAASGNAGFISPGDRVDLILTRKLRGSNQGAGGNSDERTVGKTFVRNVRVLAVDQMVDNPENKAILAKTVTVEVSENQAAQIAIAAEVGKLSLSLRSMTVPQDTAASGDKPSVENLYGQYVSDKSLGDEEATPRPAGPQTVRILRAEQVETLEFIQDTNE
jgi:pilus assembly protein CpaB